MMFEDESRFGRISNARRCWAPKGIRPSVGVQIEYEYTYVFAAVSPADGVLDSLILPEVNTETMSIFLSEVSKRHAEEFIIMFIDGAGWHKAKDLKIPENIKLIYLPPYSPELNPVEHLWEEIKEKWFTNLVFEDINAVENNLVDALVVLENDQEKIRRLTGFDWIISSIMIAT
ncbi:MAG: IS630 family transposase [bacterium]|nr:IS630 family transposase [bacterium]